MLIAETKVHPLWHTALLPALFLVSCISMGYGAVVALCTILEVSWRSRYDLGLLAKLSQVNAGILFLYVALRAADVVWSGKLHQLALDGFTALFLLELALFLAPAVLFLRPSVRRNRGKLFGAALLAVAAGAVYRIDTYITVYRPGPGWVYFPSLGEITVTIGMAALGIALFILISRLFPIIVVEEGTAPQAARPTRAA